MNFARFGRLFLGNFVVFAACYFAVNELTQRLPQVTGVLASVWVVGCNLLALFLAIKFDLWLGQRKVI